MNRLLYLSRPLPVRPSQTGQTRLRSGFTLVEILVVITIIGILAGLILPAINGALKTARATSIKMEIEEIDRGLANYATQHGDLPPDGSSWIVMNRHLNKAFPRLSAVDRTLLYNMCHEPDVAASQNPSGSTFYPTAIDRAEAIVLFLGGLSDDESRPFTGPGGPFQYVGSGVTVDPGSYQYNTDRSSPSANLEVSQMTITPLPTPTAAVSTSNRVLSDDGDPIPAYIPSAGAVPLLYFDSRTYGYISDAADYNGYVYAGTEGAGQIRPYKTNLTPPGASTYTAANVAEALGWRNPDTYQIISAGLDNNYGTIVGPTASTLTPPAYWLAETGQLMICDTSATSGVSMLASVNGFQERSVDGSVTENGHLDNITNFNTQARMEDNLEE